MRPPPTPSEVNAPSPLKSVPQSTLLRLVAQRDNDGRTWVPRSTPEPIEQAWVHVGGSGAAAAWRALVAKGLIEPSSLADFAADITEKGRVQAAVEAGRPLAWVSR